MTKHIVNIVPAFVPGDGIGNSARARVKGLLDAGYRVSVICATAKVGLNEFPGLQLMQAGAGWEAERTSLTTEMFAVVRSADLIFVEFGCFNICHELLKQVAAPLILFYQGITPAVLMQNDMYSACYWRAIGELRKLPRPSMVLAASQFTLDEYGRNAGDDPTKSRVVPLFGNTRQISRPPSPINERPFKVLTVGQLFPHKNYEVLIEATKLLVRNGLDISVQHIGGANDLIALGYRSRLQPLASSLGERFKFLGRVDQEVLDNAYADSHVVVIPSLHEGYSLPAREALIHGKPVVASCFGALPETLQGFGKRFHPLDATDLAHALAEYAAMDNRAWREECALAKSTATGHSAERYAQSCIEAIEEVLSVQSQTEGSSFAEGLPLVEGHHYEDDSRDLISGQLVYSTDSGADPASVSLEALVMSSRHLMRTRMSVRTWWETHARFVVCRYELSLVGIEDCTSIHLHFVNSKSGDREWHLGGFQRDRNPLREVGSTSREFQRLSLAIAENYSPKSIVAADGRWLTKLKTRVANMILKLVYHVFIGPQMATMQSQLRLLACAIEDLKASSRLQSHDSDNSAAPSKSP